MTKHGHPGYDCPRRDWSGVCGYPMGHRDKHLCSCTCALGKGHKGRHCCEVDATTQRDSTPPRDDTREPSKSAVSGSTGDPS